MHQISRPVVSLAAALLAAAFLSSGAARAAADGLWILTLNQSANQADWNYYPQFLAEPRGAMLKVDLVWLRPTPEYAWAKGEHGRPLLDIAAGWQIPLIGYNTAPDANLLQERGFGFGLYLPVSFHTLFDFAREEASEPIVNTDYRFAFGLLKLGLGLGGAGDWRHALALRVAPGSHESTHIGDEYIFDSQQQAIDEPFIRVNPSKWYVDFALQYSTTWTERLNLRGQAGAEIVYLGPYDTEAELSENTGTIDDPYIRTTVVELQPPDKKHLFYADLELYYRFPTEGVTSYGLLASYDFRVRPRHEFVLATEPAREEELVITHNVLAGVTFGEYLSAGGPGRFFLGLRYYRGINPHGQFRTGAATNMIGIALDYYP